VSDVFCVEVERTRAHWIACTAFDIVRKRAKTGLFAGGRCPAGPFFLAPMVARRTRPEHPRPRSSRSGSQSSAGRSIKMLAFLWGQLREGLILHRFLFPVSNLGLIAQNPVHKNLRRSSFPLYSI
jgi:hypothetical protein